MFKEKYASILSEYEKFWERKNTNRPILNFSYSIDAPAFKEPESLEQKWLDEKYILDKFRYSQNRIENKRGYIADGLPSLFTNLGPGCFSACIGGSYELTPQTVWFDGAPIVSDWENPPEISFNRDSEMWQHITRLQNHFASAPDVNFSITDLGGILDIVASLRSPDSLLYDLYDYPDEVKEFIAKVKKFWFEAFDEQIEFIRKTGQPFNNWLNIPSEKPWYPIQCDFSYMISPAHFEEFVLGDVKEQVDHMERSIFHLDGVGEIPHLDMLLDIPGLTGIQWVPGAGQHSVRNKCWYDMYRKIQDKKKNLVLGGGVSEYDVEGSERLIKSLDPTGVYISANFSSRDSAERMLENVLKWLG